MITLLYIYAVNYEFYWSIIHVIKARLPGAMRFSNVSNAFYRNSINFPSDVTFFFCFFLSCSLDQSCFIHAAPALCWLINSIVKLAAINS